MIVALFSSDIESKMIWERPCNQPELHICEDDGVFTAKDFFCFIHLSPLVRTHKVGHCFDFRVVFIPGSYQDVSSPLKCCTTTGVRLRLLTVEGIYVASHEHICQHEILEYLDALRGA
jgi:hypothetical protein